MANTKLTTRPKAGTPEQTPAHPRRSASPIERQQAIEDALNMALFFIRQPTQTGMEVFAATARTNRALSLLKQASKGYATVRTVASNAVQMSAESGRA